MKAPPCVFSVCLLLSPILLHVGCDGSTEVAPGTADMESRLLALVADADPLVDEQLNTARISYFLGLPEIDNPPAMLLRSGVIAQELMNAGYTNSALEQLVTIRELGRNEEAPPVPGFYETLEEFIGLGFLRQAGELACRNTGAGLVRPPCWRPVPSARAVLLPDSARVAFAAAADWHAAMLDRRPEDLRARWLLNVIAFQTGTWPDAVPPEHRIPEQGFGGPHQQSDGMPLLEDVAPRVGLDVVSLSGGGIVEDFNGDGLPDVLVSSRGLLDQMRYFESNGAGGFVERTEKAGLRGLVGGLNMVHADYDNDGDADVFVLRGGWLVQGYPNSLLRNDGGFFSDVTLESGIYSEHPTQTGAWGDFDGDGWLDLVIGNESRDARTHPTELFRNKGDGTFEEVGAEVGLGFAAFSKGVVWGDYDNDGLLDLYFSLLHAPNRLYRNLGPDANGRFGFEDVTASAGVSEPSASFPTWFWDFDNDGYLDIYVAGYRAQTGDLVREMEGVPHGSELPRLYRNVGDGTFADVTEAQGLDRIMYAMGSNFGDFDGDGWLDFLVGTGDPDVRQLMPNRMFRNLGDRFVEITGATGVGSLHKGHSVAFVDVDNDGDTDIHIQLGGANEGDISPNALYENPGFGMRWIALELEGVTANRSGIGARVDVSVPTPNGEVQLHRVVGTGGSFGSNPLRQEIGLGADAVTATVRIVWPGSGTIDEWVDLQVDQAYRLREGNPVAEPVTRPRIQLGGR